MRIQLVAPESTMAMSRGLVAPQKSSRCCESMIVSAKTSSAKLKVRRLEPHDCGADAKTRSDQVSSSHSGSPSRLGQSDPLSVQSESELVSLLLSSEPESELESPDSSDQKSVVFSLAALRRRAWLRLAQRSSARSTVSAILSFPPNFAHAQRAALMPSSSSP